MARFRLVLDVKGLPRPQLVVIDMLLLVDPLEDLSPKGRRNFRNGTRQESAAEYLGSATARAFVPARPIPFPSVP